MGMINDQSLVPSKFPSYEKNSSPFLFRKFSLLEVQYRVSLENVRRVMLSPLPIKFKCVILWIKFKVKHSILFNVFYHGYNSRSFFFISLLIKCDTKAIIFNLLSLFEIKVLYLIIGCSLIGTHLKKIEVEVEGPDFNTQPLQNTYL